MPHIVAVAHEFRRRELHRWPGRRRETCRDFGEPGRQRRRSDEKAEPQGGGQRLAERPDVNDAPDAIERGKRRRGPAFQLKLAQIVILDHPRRFLSGPVEKAQAPFQRQRAPERRLLPWSYDSQRRIGLMVQAITDINAVRIDRDRGERQSCELQAMPGEWETGILHPDLSPLEAEHTERQSEAAAVATGDDDLGRRTFDTA